MDGEGNHDTELAATTSAMEGEYLFAVAYSE